MFYRMIDAARDRWYRSEQCTVKDLIGYIVQRAEMRDAQVEAIKTYLYLKIGCENRPLATLFQRGVFNGIDPDAVECSAPTRAFLKSNPAAAALMEYAMLANASGGQAAKSIEEQIKKTPESIDYDRFFSNAFYGVAYTDYLFSLPMGAGKTYLMAAFIYLDLYFASNEPSNPAFAHNFIVFAPSGLKSSVIPSLRTLQRFNPAWVLPEPAATEIKKKMLFEVLDQERAANKSNRTKNPNVQKIANHQPFESLFGLIAVTNAEKVILDRIALNNGQVRLFEDSDDEKDRTANELRNLIGKLPNLSVFIDEVHHAVNDEIKLRAVVNKWSESRAINSVIGFSGTPYLARAERIAVSDVLSVASAEISNIVYYYPLIGGIGNFLKSPTVKISDIANSGRIIEDGVREFLDAYRDTVYEGGLSAKLGIYCGTIEKLERTVYPLVSRIAAEYGLPPDAILRFHRGNAQFPQPVDSQLRFSALDSSISNVRIVLLVQIGKEGWDCRSLTGIVLSQEGDCPNNMVLQTSCRCLRQVAKGVHETALIYLNESNAEKLNAQLQRQHHISLREFSSAGRPLSVIRRYDRTEYLKLPPISFYQLKIDYDTITLEAANPRAAITTAAENAKSGASTVKTQDFTGTVSDTVFDYGERGDTPAMFAQWLCGIAKSGFDFPLERLKEHEGILRGVFGDITHEKGGIRYFSSNYNRALVEANIRKGFFDKRSYTTKEELIPEDAKLLNIFNFTAEVKTDSPNDYYPEQSLVEKIILDDAGELKITGADLGLINAAENAGESEIAEMVRKKYISHPAKDRSFHYLPYKTDSGFEETFLREVLTFDVVKNLGLEVYYNGDPSLTEFKIRCYGLSGAKWSYIGKYTPDFLILRRKDGAIHSAVIVETKGRLYANDPLFLAKREFVENHFTKLNNEKFGYSRFAYLYLEDFLSEKERILRTHNAICGFFKGECANA